MRKYREAAWAFLGMYSATVCPGSLAALRFLIFTKRRKLLERPPSGSVQP